MKWDIRVGASLLSVALFGCTGPDGPKGDTGDAGAVGLPAPGIDGGIAIATSCLSPCHAFGGVVDQFKASTHYAAYSTYLGTSTADEWTASGSACGNCHAIDALAQRAAGTVGTVGGAVIPNVKNGVVEYNSSTGALADSTYTGAATVAEVYCTTCHAVTPANDPHKTGIPWTPGSFPLVAPSSPTDNVFIEKSASSSTVTGTSIGSLGPANTCVMCHKSRKDVTGYILASNVLSSTHWGPHEGPQADVFSGAGGYQYPGLTYGTSTHQVKLTCVSCHMAPVDANAGVPDHSFNPNIATCQSCHTGTTTFDVDGGQSQIKLAMGQLQAVLSNATYLTRSAAAPYLPLQPSELADNAFDLDQPRPGGTTPLTAAQAGAVYNYILIARGGALGVHNPTYVKQLLFDSYMAVAGVPPTGIARPQ